MTKTSLRLNRIAALLPAMVLASACTPMAASTAAAPPTAATATSVAQAETVQYRILSWGLPQRSWTLEADGSLLVETKAAGQPFRDYDLDQQRTRLSPEVAAQVRAGLQVARGPLPHCTVIMTDGPAIYLGCQEAAFQPIIERLMAADELVSAAVAGVPVSGKRRVAG